jgi:cytochrome c peroxidase
MWKPAPGETEEQRAFRESVARGHEVFFIRVFYVTDTAHINTVGLGNPMKRTCATCHNSAMVGTDLSAGWVDVGTTNMPFARQNVPNPFEQGIQHELPLFKITCNEEARPHPFLGRVIYTQDPGRALISGKCYDVGSIVMGQFRGLAARAPYFSNGSASTIRDLVDFYDRRFNIGYTEQEKVDLTNFLSVL